MKKTLIIAAAALIGASAFAQTVTSANVVGYVKQEVGAGQFQLLSNQFVTTNDVGATINEVFGTSLPDGSELYVYNGGGYDTYTYINGFGWIDSGFGDASGIVLERGHSLWVKNMGASATNVLFSGNVPVPAATTNALSSGFTLVANPYPTDVTISELDINPADGDELYVYSAGSYLTYTYIGGFGWIDSGFGDASSVVIPAGIGFWYKTTTPRDWVEPIPYTL